MVMSNKGSIMDLMFVIIVLFVMVISIIIVTYTNGIITTKISENIEGEAEEAVVAVNEKFEMLDYFFLAIFIGMIISMVILAFMIRSHPALFIVFILVLIVTVVVSAAISNAYYKLSLNSDLASTISTKFPMTDFLMRNLPFEIAIFGFILLIITYSKTQEMIV